MQFTDVARPRVIDQDVFCAAGECFVGFTKFAGVLLIKQNQEMFGEQRNVTGSFAQRRQIEWENRQPIK